MLKIYRLTEKCFHKKKTHPTKNKEGDFHLLSGNLSEKNIWLGILVFSFHFLQFKNSAALTPTDGISRKKNVSMLGNWSIQRME